MAKKNEKSAVYEDKRKDRLYRFDLTTIAKIDVYARMFDWHMNTLVETAVIEKIERMAKDRGLDWKLFADYATEEGELYCAMFKHAELLNSWTAREETLRRFVRDHEPFFYGADGKPNTWTIRYLWPEIDDYVELWRTAVDAWAAWRSMSAVLVRHNLPAPTMPTGARAAHGEA
jgi:MoaA/NifB/PqqE/SkfB family radical SAM enzyme